MGRAWWITSYQIPVGFRRTCGSVPALAHCVTWRIMFNKCWIVHECSSRTSLCLNSCGKEKQKSLGDFCRAAASLAHDRLMGIRAHRRWTKEEITTKRSQKIRHCSRHGCWYIKYNPAGMQNIVAAKHIPQRAQGGLQGWTTERKKMH